MQLLLLFLISIGFSLAQPLKHKDLTVSSKFVPAYIVSDSDKLVLIAEKNIGKLHLFQGVNYLYSYPMTSGLNRGDKRVEGDKKTPLGVYLIEKYFDELSLKSAYKDRASLYGVGALTLNYPNPIDKKTGKTGSSIWIHGTSTPERVKDLQSSQGCVVVNNETFSEIFSLYKQKQMVLVIVDDLEWVSKESYQENLKQFNGIRFKNQWLNFNTGKYEDRRLN